ncbi:MAG: motility protein A [Myxococcota bacterium]
MDIATLIGIVASLGTIAMAMVMGGSVDAFVNGPAIVLVFGGTIGATLINQRLTHVLGAFRVMMNAFFDRTIEPSELVPMIIHLAAKARKEGVVSLENEPISDPFIARGVRLGADGLSPDAVKSTLTSELIALRDRHERGHRIFRFMGTTAPSMGMIGTLVGLVQMLRTLDDPDQIGPSMAVAILTTRYGAILAFALFNPIAEKLANRTIEEMSAKTLAIAGIESILSGDNTLVIQSKLDAYLAPAQRDEKEAA